MSAVEERNGAGEGSLGMLLGGGRNFKWVIREGLIEKVTSGQDLKVMRE